MSAYRNPDPFFEAPAAGAPMALCNQCRCIKPSTAFAGSTNVCRVCIGRRETNPPRACPTCKEIKPWSSFWAKQQPGTAENLGYRKPYMYLAKNCRECRKQERPQRKGPRTPRQLQNAVARGAMPPGIRDEILERRAVKRRGVGTKSSIKRWDGEYEQAWSAVMGDLRAEIHRTAQALKYLRHPPERANITEGEARMAFHLAYVNAQRALKARIEQDFILARGREGKRRRPTSEWWVDYFSTEEWKALMDAWEAIDLDTRVKLRHPDLLTRNGEAMPDDPERDMLRR
jgi:hypothetical protein